MADDDAGRRQQSISALERGELPLAAQARIDDLRQGGAWTSDLSVAELAAIRHAGFEPVGMVLGSSVYRIAAQWGYLTVFGGGGGVVETYPCQHGYNTGWGNSSSDHRTGWNWEHTLFESGIIDARNAALARVLTEASDLGAHGVVGVRVIRRHLEGVGNSLEFTVIGTAIRRPGGPALRRPFMSHLDGVSFGKLLHGGYIPAGLVVGIGAVEIDPGCTMEWQLRSWGNLRIDQLSDGIEQARLLGIARLEHEIASVGADGVVGVDIDFTSHEIGGAAVLIELLAIGTAVRQYASDPLDEEPMPIMRLR